MQIDPHFISISLTILYLLTAGLGGVFREILQIIKIPIFRTREEKKNFHKNLLLRIFQRGGLGMVFMGIFLLWLAIHNWQISPPEAFLTAITLGIAANVISFRKDPRLPFS